MKKYFLTLLTGFFISTPIVYASSATTHTVTPPVAATPKPVKNFGAVELSNFDTAVLEQSGMIRLMNAKVTESFVVNGIANVENVTLNNVTINGSGSFKNSTIQGNVILNGHMDAKTSNFEKQVAISGYLNVLKSSFEQSITLQGVNANFTDATIQNLEVNTGSADLTPHVILKGCKVLGKITFTGGQGVVSVDVTTYIAPDAVKGGTIQKLQ